MMIKYKLGNRRKINPFICTYHVLGSRSKFTGGVQDDFSRKDI